MKMFNSVFDQFNSIIVSFSDLYKNTFFSIPDEKNKGENEILGKYFFKL